MGMSEVLDSIHQVNWADKERMHEHIVCASGTTVWSAWDANRPTCVCVHSYNHVCIMCKVCVCVACAYAWGMRRGGRVEVEGGGGRVVVNSIKCTGNSQAWMTREVYSHKNSNKNNENKQQQQQQKQTTNKKERVKKCDVRKLSMWMIWKGEPVHVWLVFINHTCTGSPFCRWVQ